MLYRGMDKAALDVAYNNTAAVGIPKRDQYVAGWSARSDAVRKAHGGKIDLRYGAEPRQRLDFFACGTPGAPTLAYIHGGYWQFNDKEPYAFFGETLLPAGFNLALLECTLAPAASAHHELLLAVEPIELLVIHYLSLARQQPAQTPVAEAAPLGRQLAQALTQCRIVRAPGLIAQRRMIDSHQPACASLTQPDCPIRRFTAMCRAAGLRP